MKTNMPRGFHKILFLLGIMSIMFTSCEVDDSNDYYTDRLTYGVWRDEWYVNGYPCEQELVFNYDGSGFDYYRDIYTSYRNRFFWHWENGQTTIVMAYGPNDVSYFDDVWIDWDKLSGYLDGNYVEFFRR